METVFSVIAIAAVVLSVLLVLKLLVLPIRLLFKLLINTLVGFALLWLLGLFGSGLGIAPEITLINALVVGFLGIPGVLLLIAIRLFL